MTDIQETIRREMERQGITAKELARRIGRSESSLSQALKRGNMHLDYLHDIAQALGVPPGDLLPHTENIVHCPRCGARIQVSGEEYIP